MNILTALPIDGKCYRPYRSHMVAFITALFLGDSAGRNDSWRSMSLLTLCRYRCIRQSSPFIWNYWPNSLLMSDATAYSVPILLGSLEKYFSLAALINFVVADRSYLVNRSICVAFVWGLFAVETLSKPVAGDRYSTLLYSHDAVCISAVFFAESTDRTYIWRSILLLTWFRYSWTRKNHISDW